MIEAVPLGSLLVPTVPVTVLLSLLVAVVASGRLAARAGCDPAAVRGIAEGAAWSALAGARVGYVLLNWSAFRPEPWTALYLWQPGYLLPTGVAAGIAYAAWRLERRPPAPLRGALVALGAGHAAGLAVLGAALLALHLLAPAGVLRPGDRVPDVELVDLQGRSVRLSDLAGRALIVNFWATWCPPCRREMPLLDAFHARYAPRGVSVVGIALEEPAAQVAPFVERLGVSYPIWVADPARMHAVDATRALYHRFGGVGLPTTIFVDAGGIVRGSHVGELNRAILQQRARELLAR